jgi:hypothetical protein
MRGGGRRGSDDVEPTGGVSGSEDDADEDKVGEEEEEAGEEYITSRGLKGQNGER